MRLTIRVDMTDQQAAILARIARAFLMSPEALMSQVEARLIYQAMLNPDNAVAFLASQSGKSPLECAQIQARYRAGK